MAMADMILIYMIWPGIKLYDKKLKLYDMGQGTGQDIIKVDHEQSENDSKLKHPDINLNN